LYTEYIHVRSTVMKVQTRKVQYNESE